jgi:murein peptide amidase A
MLARVGLLWTLLALLPAGCATATTTAPDLASSRAPASPPKAPRRAPVTRRSTIVLGRSAAGRQITAAVVGDPKAPRRLLVVGCIHGNEPAGIAVARALAHSGAPRGTALWILPDLNPDGVAAGTREDAHGVDLNRNFPYVWQPLGSRGALDFSGPAALSEPESRIASRLILRIRPAITIWFHQHQAVTDVSGGDVRVERRFAKLSGLPLVHLTRYPGSAAGWQDHRLPHTTAFVVELPPGPATGGALRRYVHAVRTLAADVALR